ncbi:hypothetical protein DMC30DRAFT_273263 [Rhodotorula diobovata]|uniref:GPI inositol-deacylase n=1 Tax=Rhodotorula diobovata TaxID=5288 RepID=A0A5C5FTT4_9BASI|nr:hypothetical protein DMC30DRAFT_273263 [Rhodotorula diobovata]
MPAPPIPPELVVAVFLHGFKGGADTFADLPQRLQAILEPVGVAFDPVVYPAYDTRGELHTAVENHVTWLEDLVKDKEAMFRERGGTGPVRVVLLGHSMGGLVIADSLLATLPTSSLPILGLICFDSPLVGLNPAVFKSTFDKALDVASKGQAALAALGAGYGLFKTATGSDSPGASSSSRSPSPKPATSASSSKASTSRSATKSSSSGKVSIPPPAESPSATPGSTWLSLPYLAAAGLTGAAAAFGAAYYNRDTLARHWTWATSHLSFVGELWKTDELETRLASVVAARDKGVGFHCFYTLLPAKGTTPQRTFLVVPHAPALRERFSPAHDPLARDEIQAHVQMFDKSPGTYALGRETAGLIGEWVEESRRGGMGWWKGESEGGAGGKGDVGDKARQEKVAPEEERRV